MREVFVETRNYRTFMDKLTRVDQRGAAEACLVIVDGPPGLGKTATMDHWVSQTNSVYIRAQRWWEHNDLVAELLKELGVEKLPSRRYDRFERIIRELSDLSEQAAFDDRTFSLVVDECDLISRKEAVMETLRGISDIKFLPTILVGMGSLRDNLKRFKQIESRAPNKAAFEPATLEDATALIRGLCEVPVAPDLIQFTWKAAKGFNREIVEAISRIERFGRRIEMGDAGVTMADMAGQVLMSNRDTSRDIVVPGAA